MTQFKATKFHPALYWTVIVSTSTAGTTMPDFMVLILAAHYFTRISGTLLFWMAFVLTRPLGATVGDFLASPTRRAD